MKKDKQKKLIWSLVIFFGVIIIFSLINSYSNSLEKQKEFSDQALNYSSQIESLIQSHDALIIEINQLAYDPLKEKEYVESIRNYLAWVDENKTRLYEIKSFVMTNSDSFKKAGNYEFLKESLDEVINQVNTNEANFRQILTYADNYYMKY